jgi:hypothetical protein
MCRGISGGFTELQTPPKVGYRNTGIQIKTIFNKSVVSAMPCLMLKSVQGQEFPANQERED